MVEAQQLRGMTHHLISQGCRIEDGLGGVFLKAAKETKLGTSTKSASRELLLRMEAPPLPVSPHH